jgi:hypothetical protein
MTILQCRLAKMTLPGNLSVQGFSGKLVKMSLPGKLDSDKWSTTCQPRWAIGRLQWPC